MTKDRFQRDPENILRDMQASMTKDEFHDFAIGFALYRHFSDCMTRQANNLLEKHGIDFTSLDENNFMDQQLLGIVKKNTQQKFGFYISPGIYSRWWQKQERNPVRGFWRK